MLLIIFHRLLEESILEYICSFSAHLQFQYVQKWLGYIPHHARMIFTISLYYWEAGGKIKHNPSILINFHQLPFVYNLDGVGPVDNRHFTDKHHKLKINKIKKLHATHDM